MKLFTRYNRINVAATIAIFLLGSCLFYFLVHYILLHQLDEALETERTEILAFSQKHGKLPEVLNTPDQYTFYQQASTPVREHFYNGYVRYVKGREWSRQIDFPAEVNGIAYRVTVSKPLEETEGLLSVIIVVTILLIALVLISSQLINRAVLNKLWHPFYEAIDFLKRFKVDQKGDFALKPSGIDEFDQLNKGISDVLRRVQADFESLNEFTSYAAHEMQTPLAVIRAKLELIQQDESVFRQYAGHMVAIEQAVRKLSKLYQSLLLLTKIENGQFTFTEQVRMDEVLQNKLGELDDLINTKGISIDTNIAPASLTFHAYLADILAGNILNNAVRYNFDGGMISVRLTGNELVISNTSYLPAMEQERVFQRFFRSAEAKEEGNGLGLAIVKRICEAAGYSITYSYAGGRHSFCIVF
ncbi:MAG: hypothetical protein BGO69_07045 [Bacteroidetes bacterium 46-16]|nr:MAG: hypothetical protein BGO69_07045 [Bacteroidetes bacterium 46-16]